ATLCDRIALMQNGQILSIDTPQKIVQNYPNPLYAVKATDMQRLIQVLSTYHPTIHAYIFGEYIHVDGETGNAPDFTDNLTSFLTDKGFEDIEVKPTPPTIEDCFIKLLTN